MSNYPRSVDELDLDGVRIDDGVLAVVRAFAASKPWRGSVEGRKLKFVQLKDALSAAFGVPAPHLLFQTDDSHDSAISFYDPRSQTIHLIGRLSVVTLLHELMHHIFGPCERKACQFSLALFKHAFPRSFARLQFEGHMARKT
jgi:hypothetical protein